MLGTDFAHLSGGSPSNGRRQFIKTAGATGVAILALTPEWSFARGLAADPINVAVIGAGRHARAILDELSKFENAKVTAICDIVPSRLSAALRRVQGATGYADHKDLLAKATDVTVVFVVTPTHTHKEISLDAIAAGKHVFIEAPMAHTIEDCAEIARAARSSSKVVHVGLYARSNPIYKLARTFFRSDSVRDLVTMRAQSNRKNEWRVPVSDPKDDRALNWRLDPEVSIGLPGEFGCHQVDVFNWYLGKYPVSVSGTGSIRLHKDGRKVPDTTHATFLFEDGARLDWSATLANSYEGQYEVLYGTNAAIKLAWTAAWMFKEADAPTQGWEVYANRQRFHNDEGITLIADATKLASQGKLKEGVGLPNPPVYYAIGDFIDAIANAKPAVVSADEGLRATAISILANKAVLDGSRIDISPDSLKV
ncbi:MAG: Gfo/Idh/MocA family oxidoreductase [Phycisphaeraceae bacterium]|nr:MAG: Gfo/Idh/MocA family oxidoreductase [Phycisphaeraceae bacterium]